MNSLDVTRINIYALYKVWSNGEIYRFETDNARTLTLSGRNCLVVSGMTTPP